MEDKLNKAIEYYTFKSKEIIDFINSSKHLTVEQIIQNAEELSVLEHKLTALEVVKEKY